MGPSGPVYLVDEPGPGAQSFRCFDQCVAFIPRLRDGGAHSGGDELHDEKGAPLDLVLLAAARAPQTVQQIGKLLSMRAAIGGIDFLQRLVGQGRRHRPRDGHLLAAWVALWTVTFAALALLTSPLRKLANTGARWFSNYRTARAARLEEEEMWELARHDHRVMADIRMASIRQTQG